MVNSVCIIDDDDISLYLTSLVLEEADIAREISSFSSVDTAIEAFPPAKTAHMPDIILLDLNMPEKNGWDFLEMLRHRENELLDNTHIFILTSSIAASDKARSQNYPLVRGFLHKPLSEESITHIRKVSVSPR